MNNIYKNYDLFDCPNCGRGPWTIHEIENGKCPSCEDDREELFECPTCGRGWWTDYEIENDQCPLCRGEMDEDDFDY